MTGEVDETTMRRVGWGYPVRTASDACIAAIEAYCEQVLTYGRDRAVILSAARRDPSCVLANILAAHFLASKNPSEASGFLRAASVSFENATLYERAVFGAISCLVADDKDEQLALNRHLELLKAFPKDLLSLKRVQVLYFYMGRPDLSLNIVQQVIVHNEDQSYIYGMLSFPLLELGRMDEAAGAARKGLSINNQDLWSQHNLCHVLQYECRFKEAADFMEACSSSWNSCSSFMLTHNWWHVAVCYLEGDSPLSKVLEIYDHYIWKELQRTDAEPAEVYVNALGLLLRIYVRGHVDDIADRLKLLANVLKDESTWHVEWLIDILALWALAWSKETTKAADLLESIKSRFSVLGRKKQQLMQRAILLAEAIYEYGRGNFHRVFDLLGPDYDAIDFKMIGASDEQLDVLNEVWFIVLLNIGQISKVIELVTKQVSKREGAPFLWRLLERAYSMEGRPDAPLAGEKAKTLEASYF
ncbi:tetratricopeptide repeat protein 38 isoform X2 [Canna indica]|uniref:Tetratricopeptide repeat protein 38 n=1 Tax=Canna indica TaxID=4628 RepID=A0AAQ3K543_9LILI|nr:tetratricopeptide repeat protein 38 isoform X2 [Canna indica]